MCPSSVSHLSNRGQPPKRAPKSECDKPPCSTSQKVQTPASSASMSPRTPHGPLTWPAMDADSRRRAGGPKGLGGFFCLAHPSTTIVNMRQVTHAVNGLCLRRSFLASNNLNL